MKKIIIIVIVIAILLIGIGFILKKEPEEKTGKKIKPTPVLELKEYKSLKLNRIKAAKMKRYTEGGLEETSAKDQEEIEAMYNRISHLQIISETTQACEDNTTVYEFTMEDDSIINVEIECDWIIIGNKRYMIEQKAS